MDTTLFFLLLIAIAGAAVWIRGHVIAQSHPRYRALVFLSLHSRETDEVLGAGVTSTTAHLYKAVSLRCQPSPGMELDGLGTGPVKIARAVLEDGARQDVYVQLTPLVIAAEEIEPYMASLVADLGWKQLELEPPYPAVAPNNSFKPNPLRSAHNTAD